MCLVSIKWWNCHYFVRVFRFFRDLFVVKMHNYLCISIFYIEPDMSNFLFFKDVNAFYCVALFNKTKLPNLSVKSVSQINKWDVLALISCMYIVVLYLWQVTNSRKDETSCFRFVLKPFGLKKHLDISKTLTFNHFDFEADFIFNFGSAVRKCNNREINVEIYINVTLV